ncbi:hypothetical protein K3495_g15731 [Podosphaera aphanis]|nr:hypothetical protein K3495_g15731 [Podosphaera aphanis]
MEGLVARVDPMARSTSDHETISGLVHLSPVQRRFPSMKLPKFNTETTEIFCQALTATAPPSLPFQEPSSLLIDAAASLGTAVLSAILLTANPPRPAYVPCKDYWNQECSDHRRRYINARNSGYPHLISEAHQSLRKTVKRAKREHKRSKLDMLRIATLGMCGVHE